MQYVAFALSGLLIGGAIAMWQQKKPLWVRVLFGVLAVLFLILGMRASTP